MVPAAARALDTFTLRSHLLAGHHGSEYVWASLDRSGRVVPHEHRQLRADGLCIAGGSHARHLALSIPGAIWVTHCYAGRAFNPQQLRKCTRGMLLHFGQWDASYRSKAYFLGGATRQAGHRPG